jgi:hypothetical protein
MMDTKCAYRGNRDEMIVASLYDALEPRERADFDAHVAGCTACRLELSELGAVRLQLAEWSPPEPVAGWMSRPGAAYGAPKKILRGWPTRIGEMPAWAQVAAAMVLLGVAAGAANLDVTYNQNGLTVRTGWIRSAGQAAPTVGTEAIASAPWRADLAALEQQLRTELQATPAARLASQRDDAADALLMRRVRALIDDSEKRQRRELALSVAESASGNGVQRVQDARNADRNVNAVQSNPGVDAMRLYKIALP